MKLISMKKDSDDMGEAAYCRSAKYGYGDDKGTEVCICLQITDMGLTTGGKLKNAANLLYGADDK